jgi:hypothetical protein
MGGKSSTQTVENKPPKWAEPLLKEGANAAMDLYRSGKGYNVYQGPTQAQFSPQSLQGMNSLLAATGGGAPITNESVFNTPQIQQAQQMIQQIAAQNAAKQAPAPPVQQQVKPKKKERDWDAGSGGGLW